MEAGRKIPAVGTKREVFLGLARHTSGGLTKADLMKNKSGKIVSRRKHEQALRAGIHSRIASQTIPKGSKKIRPMK